MQKSPLLRRLLAADFNRILWITNVNIFSSSFKTRLPFKRVFLYNICIFFNTRQKRHLILLFFEKYILAFDSNLIEFYILFILIFIFWNKSDDYLYLYIKNLKNHVWNQFFRTQIQYCVGGKVILNGYCLVKNKC